MTVNQISIFLENKYGKLSEILALLAEERIRIIAATVAAAAKCFPEPPNKLLRRNIAPRILDISLV